MCLRPFSDFEISHNIALDNTYLTNILRIKLQSGFLYVSVNKKKNHNLWDNEESTPWVSLQLLIFIISWFFHGQIFLS
jgi:succinate dehydrogenase hydrophobic anchor subunit